MRSAFRRSWSTAGILALTAMLLVLPAAASAADFLLTANNWGKAQDDAVADAGGTVVWSHSGTGIASVTSDDPDFLERVSDDKAFTGAAEDMMVQWQDPSLIEQGHITPGDEPLFPL